MSRSRALTWAVRARHLLALLLALSAAALAAAALDVRPELAIVSLVATAGLAGYLLRTVAQRGLVEELRERRKFADPLLQSMAEAVMVLDANHRVIDVNRRWGELTGHGTPPADPPPLPPTGGDWLLPRADGT